MKRKTARANNAFLLGSLILIVLVLVVIVLFMFMAFKIYDKKESYTERYEIVLGTSTLNNPLTVYMNDSILFNGTPQSSLTLSVGRFAKESSLLIVDGTSDIVSTIELSNHSETVKISKKGNKFYRDTAE